MKKRILVISWFYPPVNSSEGLVTYKLLKASKYDYDVFTQKTNALWYYGNKDVLPETKNINTIFAKAKDLQEWIQEAVNYYKENKDKYDIVMTRSMPEESHITGLEIKRINPQIIWIASFGDPIGENPYVLKMLKEKNPYSVTGIRSMLSVKRFVKSYLFKRNKKYNYNNLIKVKSNLEEEIAECADKIILNNKYQKEYMAKSKKNFNKFIDKSVVIEHSYDKSLYKENEQKQNNKIVFRYIGHLDEIRTPIYLLKALRILNKKDDKISDIAQFEFYGNLSDKDKLFIMDNDLLNLVHIKKTVGYLQSLELMKDSDWLIHIDANISDVVNENIFFAAKLADYIGSQRNIIGLTMLDGASADILRNHNKLCICNCTSEIVNYLYKIIYEKYTLEKDISYEELESKTVVQKLDKLIESLE